MEYKEIEEKLKKIQVNLTKSQTLDFQYDTYLELTIIKSELHKLIHFCIDDYERKCYFSLIDFASSLQLVTSQKIDEVFKEKRQNLKYDFEIEKKYLESTLEEKINKAILFQEFSKEILSKKQYSHINNLARHCAELNLKVADYIKDNLITDNQDEN